MEKFDCDTTISKIQNEKKNFDCYVAHLKPEERINFLTNRLKHSNAIIERHNLTHVVVGEDK